MIGAIIMDSAVAIHCEISGKLLARRDARGVYLWCKVCKTEHFIPWTPEESNEQMSDKVASDADLCYNSGR
jgi:hypothetical protein